MCFNSLDPFCGQYLFYFFISYLSDQMPGPCVCDIELRQGFYTVAEHDSCILTI